MTTNQEPVPATNQAGEVERLRALYATHEAWPVDKHPRNGASSEEWEPFYAANRARRDLLDAMPALFSALATQPATSQEGEEALRAEVKRLRELLGDYGEKRAPVQGLQGGIPWDMHLRAYNEYCRQYSPQKSLIEGGCRGGFGVRELDKFIPGWRDELKDRADSARATPTHPTLPEDLREALELLRRREVQMMGAAISTRNWHDMETAYNAGRDRLDAVLIEIRRAARAQGPE